MKRAFVALAVVACTGALALPRAAEAAEPYDSALLALLVAPADTTYQEITDAADLARSGPLDTARLAAMGVTLPAKVAATMRGAALRGYTDGVRRVVEIGYELTDAASARASVDATKGLGTSFDVDGLPGAVGRTATSGGRPTAAIAFTVSARSFLVIVGGPDPEHGLVQDQALRIAGEAAGALAAGAAGTAPGPMASVAAAADGAAPVDGAAPRGTVAPKGAVAVDPAVDADVEAIDDGSIAARLRRVVESNDGRLALAAVAAVLLWLLLRSSGRRSQRTVVAPRTMQRTGTAGWHQTSWGPGAAWPSVANPAGGADAGVPAVSPLWPTPTLDSLAPADRAESTATAARTPEAPMADDASAPPPGAPASVDASTPGTAPEVAGPDGERYAFPGAEHWPDDASERRP